MGPRTLALRLLRAAEARLAGPPPSAGTGQSGWQYRDGAGDPRWLEMGRWSYGRPRVHVYEGDTNRVVIGSFCSIARDCEFMVGGNHRSDWVTTWPMKEVFGGAPTGDTLWSRGDIIVGNDVWIGHGARILSGVSIGHGAVIGAYAVVTRDVRPYAVVAGSPAQEVRRRFDDEVVDALLRIAWWDWSDETLAQRWAEMCNADVGAFVRKYGPAARSPG